jgi:hypothetical protein
MDYTDDLFALENSLRTIIDQIGLENHGGKYLGALGVSSGAQGNWETRREREAQRRGSGFAEQRLLYFADFGDLEEIILANWALFEPVFDDKARTTVYLRKLRELRNPDAHRRELTQSEKALVAGLTGDLRTQITRYLSIRDTPDEFFPRMESLRDSLGNAMNTTPRPVVRVGDRIEFIAEAWDPFGAELEFQWSAGSGHDQVEQDWSTSNRFVWIVQPSHVANPAWVNCSMRGPREPHAEGSRDAGWSMAYTVLPNRWRSAE